MSIDERTVKCPICGEPYKVYAFSAADQSACPQCVKKAAAKDDKGMRPYTDHRKTLLCSQQTRPHPMTDTDARTSEEFVVEFKAAYQWGSGAAWVQTPTTQTFPSLRSALDWIATYGTDVLYRVTQTVAGPLSVQAAREAAQAAKESGHEKR